VLLFVVPVYQYCISDLMLNKLPVKYQLINSAIKKVLYEKHGRAGLKIIVISRPMILKKIGRGAGWPPQRRSDAERGNQRYSAYTYSCSYLRFDKHGFKKVLILEKITPGYV